MTRTIVASKSKTVIIGFDQPFCVIGERINPTGRKQLAAELEVGDFSTVEADALRAGRLRRADARRELGCGLHQQDGRGPALRRQQLRRADADARARRPHPGRRRRAALHRQLGAGRAQAGLEAAEGRPLLNSVTGEEERLELVLPLVKKYDVPVVAISNDDTGISEDPDVRFAVAKKIVQRAADFGIPAHDIVVDPLVMPIGAMATAGLQVFALVRRLREELGVNTTCGASNISFGLPQPPRNQRRLPADGDGLGDDLRDHEPDPRRRRWTRSAPPTSSPTTTPRRGLDPGQQGAARRGRGRGRRPRPPRRPGTPARVSGG